MSAAAPAAQQCAFITFCIAQSLPVGTVKFRAKTYIGELRQKVTELSKGPNKAAVEASQAEIAEIEAYIKKLDAAAPPAATAKTAASVAAGAMAAKK